MSKKIFYTITTGILITVFGGIILEIVKPHFISAEAPAETVESKVNFEETSVDYSKDSHKPSTPSTNNLPVSPFKITEVKSGNTNPKIETYLKEIFTTLNLNYTQVNGTVQTIFNPNKSVPGQLSAQLELALTIDNKTLFFTLYGRGSNETEAVNHALKMNKEMITNKIKSI